MSQTPPAGPEMCFSGGMVIGPAENRENLGHRALGHLNCPRCGLSLRLRAAWLTVEHCPRCVARNRLLVPLRPTTPATETNLAEGPGE